MDISLLASLSANRWTDFNTTDPGIALLEALLFAQEDIAYRTGFPMGDLVAEDPNFATESRFFFPAIEMLPRAPVTANDYRKLLIDMDGVRNAVVYQTTNPDTKIWFHPYDNALVFDNEGDDSNIEVPLSGVMAANIDVDHDIALGADRNAVIEACRQKLNAHRGLASEFGIVSYLHDQNVFFLLDMEIGTDENIHLLTAKILCALESFLTPSVPFSSREECLEAGDTFDTIYNGPALTNGFIRDDILTQATPQRLVSQAAIIDLLQNVSGITLIRKAQLSSDGENFSDNDIAIGQEHRGWITALIDDEALAAFCAHCRFYAPGSSTAKTADATKVRAHITTLAEEAEQEKYKGGQDYAPEAGRYRKLTDYLSAQYELPGNFGVGAHELGSSATNLRLAQVKQLQAYLTVYDQILASYLAQLDGAKYLLASDLDATENTYWGDIWHASRIIRESFRSYMKVPLPENTPGLSNLYAEYPANVPGLSNNEQIDRDRLNRLLNHLLARHGEAMPATSVLFPDAEEPQEASINAKRALLGDIPKIGARHGLGANLAEAVWDSEENVSGLRRRLCRLLDLPVVEGKLSDGAAMSDGFHIVEHLTLRPIEQCGSCRFYHPDTDNGDSNTYMRVVSYATKSGAYNWVNHNLNEGDEVYLLGQGLKNPASPMGPKSVLKNNGNGSKRDYALEFFVDTGAEVSDATCIHLSLGWFTPADKYNEDSTPWHTFPYLMSADLGEGGDLPGGEDGEKSVRLALSQIVLNEEHPSKEDDPPRTPISGHFIEVGDTIEIRHVPAEGDQGLNGVHRVIAVAEDSFDIDYTYNAETHAPTQVDWCRNPLFTDPFSNQITIFAPKTLGESRSSADGGAAYRDLFETLVHRETPAHITPYIYYLDAEQMQSFEGAYEIWLNKRKVYDTAGSDQARFEAAVALNAASRDMLHWLRYYKPADLEPLPTLSGVGYWKITQATEPDGPFAPQDFRVSQGEA